jgi:tRNA A37 methylthiotransferase MiaB
MLPELPPSIPEVQPRRLCVHTLGCKLNYAETSALAAQFRQRDFEVVQMGQPTEVFLLNTCSVTENAERECRQVIRRLLRQSPEAFVIVTGCYAQLSPEEIASIDGVDAVLGAQEKFEIFRHFTSFQKREQRKISIWPPVLPEEVVLEPISKFRMVATTRVPSAQSPEREESPGRLWLKLS